jgi:hypothetical protein
VNDLGHMIYGGFFAVFDMVVFFCAVSSSRVKAFSIRLCFAYYCIVDLIFNILHLAQGLGCKWATTGLRVKALAVFIIPNIILVVWVILKLKKQDRDKDT